MLLYIDTREKYVINQLTKDFEYEIKPLDIGDFHIIPNTQSDPVLIIERKTITDLNASILDGRYKEQKARLMASGIPVCYIIETNEMMNPKTKGAIINTQIRDRISVLMSSNIENTINIIKTLLKKTPEYFTSKWDVSKYDSIQPKKSSNYTKHNVYISQLCCIKGVSPQIANTIAQHYITMKDLIINLNDTPDGKLLLSKLPKIGKVLSERIFSYLCTDTDDCI